MCVCLCVYQRLQTMHDSGVLKSSRRGSTMHDDSDDSQKRDSSLNNYWDVSPPPLARTHEPKTKNARKDAK